MLCDIYLSAMKVIFLVHLLGLRVDKSRHLSQTQPVGERIDKRDALMGEGLMSLGDCTQDTPHILLQKLGPSFWPILQNLELFYAPKIILILFIVQIRRKKKNQRK
jgi:hypothetical protein